MVIFGMIYANFFPLIGEYEKREVYDDIDSKYNVYWIKRMIESSEYNLKKDVITKYGYIRFQCKDLVNGNSVTMCKDIVKSLQVNNCDKEGNNCDIFITEYQLDDETTTIRLKDVASTNKKREAECNNTACSETYNTVCLYNNNNSSEECTKQIKKRIFSDGFKTYLSYLPNYLKRSSTGAKYRVTAIFHNRKDANNYYSYSTIEVIR